MDSAAMTVTTASESAKIRVMIPDALFELLVRQEEATRRESAAQSAMTGFVIVTYLVRRRGERRGLRTGDGFLAH